MRELTPLLQKLSALEPGHAFTIKQQIEKNHLYLVKKDENNFLFNKWLSIPTWQVVIRAYIAGKQSFYVTIFEVIEKSTTEPGVWVSHGLFDSKVKAEKYEVFRLFNNLSIISIEERKLNCPRVFTDPVKV